MLNKVQQNINTKNQSKELRYNLSAIKKMKKIITKYTSEKNIRLPINIIWIIFKGSIKSRDSLTLSEVIKKIMRFIPDMDKIKIEAIKNIVKEAKKSEYFKRVNYNSLIIELNKDIDTYSLNIEKENLEKIFEINGISILFNNFYNSLIRGIDNGEEYNIVTYIDGSILIDKLAPTDILYGEVEKRSKTEILHYTSRYIDAILNSINNKLKGIDPSLLIKPVDIIEKIEFIGGINNIIEVYKKSTLLELEEIIMDKNIDFIYKDEEFKKLDIIDRKIIGDIIKTILISIDNESDKFIVGKIFDGFKIDTKTFTIFLKGTTAENRHIRNKLKKLDFGSFSEIGYNIKIKQITENNNF